MTVNYGEFPYKLENGSELPPNGYRIKDERRSQTGSVETRLVVN